MQTITFTADDNVGRIEINQSLAASNSDGL